MCVKLTAPEFSLLSKYKKKNCYEKIVPENNLIKYFTLA